jgi:hypothetical protein
MLDRWLDEGVRWIFLNLHELRLYYGAYFVPRLTEAEVARFEASIASPRLREVHRDARFDIRILEILPRGGANEQAQRGERRRR